MCSSYLDQEVWLINHSVLVLGRKWGDTEDFPKCCVNLCIVIFHLGVQVWAPLVWRPIMFSLGGNKSCLDTPPYLELCVASCQFPPNVVILHSFASLFEDFFKMF